MTRVAIYFFNLCFILLIASPVLAEKRVALVIGNSTYKNISKLSNPVNDARLMARVLKEQGFEVVQGLDLEYRAMKRLIRSYTKKLQDYGRDTVGFIFYAGHGLQIGGTNYLIPVGAEIGKQGDVDIEAISASSLLFGVKEARNRLNIIVLDACRNNPYRGMFRSVSRGLSQMSAPSGSLIAFSTGPGDVAADGTGKNSPFTAALAKSLRVPGLTIERVFKKARQQVYDSSNKQQLPWINSSLLGEFYPAGQQREKTVRSEPVKSSDAAREWQTLSNSNDIGDLKAFIAQFGERFPYYGRKARKRLNKLKEKKMAVGVFPKPQQKRMRLPYEPEVVHIPGGTFSMGCVSGIDCQDDEIPVHRVTVGSFYLSKYEATFAQWDACVKDGGCKHKPDDKGWGRGNRPVINVSWNDAVSYARWLSLKTKQQWRLPTEAEWEYATRGDMSGKNKTKYSWGNGVSCSKASYDGGKSSSCYFKPNGRYRGTKTVGSFDGNAFGLHDLHGNAWEWVHDWYGQYKKGSQTDPKGPVLGAGRVVRGGSWAVNAGILRSADRIIIQPGDRYDVLGFRLLRQSVEAKSQETNTPNTCITIGRNIPRRIKLSVGTRFCDAGGKSEALVVKIANRAVVFLDNGASKTCSQGRLCAFNWPVKPLFRITARADAARGIAPQATMEPR